MSIKNNQKKPISYKIKGSTLLELLVSMGLGVVILSGMMSMYFGSKTSDKTRTELSDIEANARVALNALRQTIEHAGYRTLEDIHIDKPFQTSTLENPSCRDGKNLVVNQKLLAISPASLTSDGAKYDRITTIFGADNPDKGAIYLDCENSGYETSTSTAIADKKRQIACSTDKEHKEDLGDTADGMQIPNQAKIYNYFSVNPRTKQLFCYGSRSTSSKEFIIADNISALQFRYGVVVDDKTIYKNATKVDDDNEWEAVTSVQVAILVESEKDILPKAKKQVFSLLNHSVTMQNSKKMYKVYNTTINLENRRRRGFE